MLGRGTRWLGAGLLLWGCNQLYGIDDLRYVEGASTSSVGGSGEGGGAGSGGMGGAPPTGAVSWVRGYGEGLVVTIADMAVLTDGRIALVGWFQGGDLVLDQTLSPIEGELRPAFFALFDAAGTPLFSSLIGEGALELALAAGPDALYLAVSYDMPIALGMDLSPSTLADVVVARFVEVSGTFGIDWVRSFASTGTQRSPRLVSTDLGVLLALEYAPAFQIGGLTMVALGGRDIALVDLDLGGTAIDARSLGGAEQDLLDALVATPSGFYLGGQHLAALDDEDCSLPSPKGNANFVLSLDALATCKTALSFGSPLTNAPIRLAPAPSGYFVAGHSDGMLDLVGATSQGDNDMFLARIDD
ncbi:MAG: hypothetical protein KC731_14115, partial [Myxococcales bacterium]|nr:hypothetical protein [Myxococcales bacterium]